MLSHPFSFKLNLKKLLFGAKYSFRYWSFLLTVGDALTMLSNEIGDKNCFLNILFVFHVMPCSQLPWSLVRKAKGTTSLSPLNTYTKSISCWLIT